MDEIAVFLIDFVLGISVVGLAMYCWHLINEYNLLEKQLEKAEAFANWHSQNATNYRHFLRKEGLYQKFCEDDSNPVLELEPEPNTLGPPWEYAFDDEAKPTDLTPNVIALPDKSKKDEAKEAYDKLSPEDKLTLSQIIDRLRKASEGSLAAVNS